ncbi:MAG: TIR domain-containing protein [Rubrivivax sp.]
MSAAAQVAHAAGAAADPARGCIVTFYSYKGGTGRSMALANTACALGLGPGEEQRVLVVDWDLEAPGLHRFFPGRRRNLAPGLGLDEQPGLIDLLRELRDALPATPPADEDDARRHAGQALDRIDLDRYLTATEHRGVWMLRAGRDDDGGYSRRVNTFDWEALFKRAPTLYRALGERLARRFRWVLVDSRTGVTDISGICTALLPDKLVVVFTPNRQSLSGVRELVSRALAYRRNSDDARPLMMYPLPSRIEASLEEQRRDWRIGNAEAGIVGFQPVFEDLFRECYGLPACHLGAYFDAVQIQQTPDCAYGEVISVRDGDGDRFSLARSYRVFVERLVGQAPPWAPHDAAAPATAPAAAAADDDPFAALSGDRSFIRPGPARPPAAPHAPPPPPAPPAGPRVFVSYASQDRARAESIVAVLMQQGLDVWWDRESLLAGESWRRRIESQLDQADVVLVLWSQASVNSDFVQEEAAEGMRRGVLLPALLDEVTPPLLFRGVQALSMVRGDADDHQRLAQAARRIAERDVGDRTVIIPATRAPAEWAPSAPRSMATPPAASAAPMPAAMPARSRLPVLAGVVALLLAAAAGVALWLPARTGPQPVGPVASAPPPAPAPIATVVVPDVMRLDSEVAASRLRSEGLEVRMVEKGQLEDRDRVDGVVVTQSLAAGTVVASGTRVRLTVATQTTRVPDVQNLSWPEAQGKLRAAGLVVESTPLREPSEQRAGLVLRVYPAPGDRVAAGSPVQVTLSGGPAGDGQKKSAR